MTCSARAGSARECLARECLARECLARECLARELTVPPCDLEPVLTLPPPSVLTYVGGVDRGAGLGAALWLGRAV